VTPVKIGSVTIVIGVMNFKPIMKYGSVIDAMPSFARIAMKWINATIAEKSCAMDVVPY
jgi:hypothetical protein